MPTVYVDSTNGDDANGGTSWGDAFQTLGAVTLAADLTLYTDGQFHERINNVSSKDNFTWIGDQGPTGRTIVDGRRFLASWSDEGSNVWSHTLGAEPHDVAFRYGPDSTSGTVTGVVQSEGILLAGLDYVRAHYGWLDRTSGTESAPGDGEWGYTGGTLYVNRGAGLTPADDFGYVEQGNQACVWAGDNIHIEGIIFRGYCAINSNSGYAVQLQHCSVGLIKRCIAIDSGYHAFGAAVTSNNDNITIEDCEIWGIQDQDRLSVGAVGSGVVMFNSTGGTGDTLRVNGLSVNSYPMLKWDGTPIETINDYQAGYSHTGDSGTLTDIEYRRVYHKTWESELETKHSASYSFVLRPPTASNLPTTAVTTNTDQMASYPFRYYGTGEDDIWNGPFPNMQDGGAYQRVTHIDTRVHTAGTEAGDPLRIWIDRGQLHISCVKAFTNATDNGSGWWVLNKTSGGKLVLRGCTVYSTDASEFANANSAGLFHFGGGADDATEYIDATACIFHGGLATSENMKFIYTSTGNYNLADLQTMTNFKDCWFGQYTTGSGFVRGIGALPDFNRTDGVAGLSTGNGVDDQTIDFEDEANLDFSPAAGGDLRTTVAPDLHTDMIGILGINGNPYDGHYGAYQYGTNGSAPAIRPARGGRVSSLRVR